MKGECPIFASPDGQYPEFELRQRAAVTLEVPVEQVSPRRQEVWRWSRRSMLCCGSANSTGGSGMNTRTIAIIALVIAVILVIVLFVI